MFDEKVGVEHLRVGEGAEDLVNSFSSVEEFVSHHCIYSSTVGKD